MDPNIITAIISATITLFGLGFAYFQWRRDVQDRLNELHDEITAELIRQRISSYTSLVEKLETMSGIHENAIRENPEIVKNFLGILQDALYGQVGLLASHLTRELIVYARAGGRQYLEGDLDYNQLLARIWAVHQGLRSDVGIHQPNWPSDIERTRERIVATNSHEIENRVNSATHFIYTENSEDSN